MGGRYSNIYGCWTGGGGAVRQTNRQFLAKSVWTVDGWCPIGWYMYPSLLWTCRIKKKNQVPQPIETVGAGALLCHQEACCDVWHDLWSQCCEGGCVPSRSVLPLRCRGCGETAPVWVHQCASAPLCGSCRERAGRGWPKARWGLRHSGQLSSSAWKAIQGDLRSVRVDGVRCPSAPTAALPLLLWWAALDGDSRILWLWHHGGRGEEAEGARGNAA